MHLFSGTSVNGLLCITLSSSVHNRGIKVCVTLRSRRITILLMRRNIRATWRYLANIYTHNFIYLSSLTHNMVICTLLTSARGAVRRHWAFRACFSVAFWLYTRPACILSSWCCEWKEIEREKESAWWPQSDIEQQELSNHFEAKELCVCHGNIHQMQRNTTSSRGINRQQNIIIIMRNTMTSLCTPIRTYPKDWVPALFVHVSRQWPALLWTWAKIKQ